MNSSSSNDRGLVPLLLLLLCYLLGLYTTPAALVLQVGRNFTGAVSGNTVSGTFAEPPDAALAVGTNHIVELINGRFSVFTKAGVRLQTMTDSTFWANAGVTGIPSGGISDPRVFFDTVSQRWFATMVDVPSSQISNRFLVAISATNDPTSSWNGTAFVADPVTGDFADFPTFGIDSNGVYLSGDMFDSLGGNAGATLFSIPKADLLAIPPSVARRTSFGILDYTNYGAVLQPAVTIGPNSDPEPILAVGDLGYDFLTHSNLVGSKVQGANTAGATLGARLQISIPSYSIPINPAEPGRTDYIDDGDARISAIVYRLGNILYAVHGTEVDSRAAIQWFKINATNLALIETGIIKDPVLDLFYPSIAANSNGTMVLAFNGSSSTNFISCFAILAEPINGSMSFGNMVLLKAGVANYFTTPTTARWGDYSAVVMDPAAPTHFWALTQYPSSSSGYTMQITELIAANLSVAATHSGTNLLVTWPAAASGYQLVSSTNLIPSVWTAVSQSPILTNNQFAVSIPLTNKARFFRLKK